MKNDGHIGFIKLSTVYVVKSPVLGLQWAFFQKIQDFFSKVKI